MSKKFFRCCRSGESFPVRLQDIIKINKALNALIAESLDDVEHPSILLAEKSTNKQALTREDQDNNLVIH